jgi:NAD(P)-dependent dehydrogenase (short-subunit alcohol dehydrogenase family)
MTLSIVTGANRGIGLALTSALKQRGGQVLAVCRSSSPALEALGVEVLAGIDVTHPDCGTTISEKIGNRTVDLLINNAGILVWDDTIESPDFDGIMKQFAVNAVGPLRVTAALRTKFTRGSKVAFITSRMGSIADNGSGGAYGYRMSKAALNIAAVSMHRDLSPAGVSVAILHPGMVKTDMIGDHGQIEPEEAARGLLTRIDELGPATSGRFFHQNGEELPW